MDMEKLKAYEKTLEEMKSTVELPRSNVLSTSTSDAIIEHYKNVTKLKTTEDTFTVIAIFAQQGATARSCDGNMSIKIKEQTFKLSELRKTFSINKCKNGIRKFARTHATEIHFICSKLQIPGNLYNKLQKRQPNLNITAEESYWMSDFQAYNPDCPKDIRDKIIQSFPKSKQK